MAEGHSIIRWSRWLAPLVDEPLLQIQAPAKWQALVQKLLAGVWPSSPLALSRIHTHGKHLLLHLSNGYTIHCHGLMYGTWQVGKAGMKLRKPEARVRLRLQTAGHDAAFFNGPVVEFLTQQELQGHDRLRALGPDILHANFDRAETWRRLRLRKNMVRSLGDAVLDQTILAGVGNIFKSEGLFLAKLDPRRLVCDVSEKDWNHFLDSTLPLMQAAAKTTGPILTLPPNFRRGRRGRDARNFVYFRVGSSCYLCGRKIQRIIQGEMKRSTYFCATCQK